MGMLGIEVREKAAVLIDSGYGKRALANALAISVSIAEHWIYSYKAVAKEGFLGRGSKRRTYDRETKLAAVHDFLEGGLAKQEAMAQQKEMLDMLIPKISEGARPVMQSDMGWQYQHIGYYGRLEEAGIVQSMSRKGTCIDNGAAEQVFGHLKDEFFRGRSSRTSRRSRGA